MVAIEDIFTHFMALSKQAQRNGKITILVLLYTIRWWFLQPVCALIDIDHLKGLHVSL